MVPDFVPLPTTIVILVAELTVNERALTPLTVTLVAPARFVPVSTTLVPELPQPGLSAVRVGGGGITVNGLALVAMPSAAMIRMYPEVLPAPTTKVSRVGEL